MFDDLRAAVRDPVPALADRVAFLSDARAHHAHGPSGPVTVIETHMSWVFLVGAHALKLKKPVLQPFLDFSTVQSRELHCREEVRLNTRLAPDVYLGVMALQWDGRQLHLRHDRNVDPSQRTLDWAVLMRRLDEAHLLDRRIAARAVTAPQIDALGQTLSAFYRGAACVPMAPGEYLGRLHRECALHREMLVRRRLSLPGAADALQRYAQALDRHADLLESRVRERRIVEGHGDLRPEHICLCDPPRIIDALEFSPLLRQVDPMDELAFLGLECELAGASWIGPRLVAAVGRALDDDPAPMLLPLYAASRALLRARLSMAHLLDAQPRTPERWQPQAARYLERARRALDSIDLLDAVSRFRRDAPTSRASGGWPVPGRALPAPT